MIDFLGCDFKFFLTLTWLGLALCLPLIDWKMAASLRLQEFNPGYELWHVCSDPDIIRCHCRCLHDWHDDRKAGGKRMWKGLVTFLDQTWCGMSILLVVQGRNHDFSMAWYLCLALAMWHVILIVVQGRNHDFSMAWYLCMALAHASMSNSCALKLSFVMGCSVICQVQSGILGYPRRLCGKLGHVLAL